MTGKRALRSVFVLYCGAIAILLGRLIVNSDVGSHFAMLDEQGWQATAPNYVGQTIIGLPSEATRAPDASWTYRGDSARSGQTNESLVLPLKPSWSTERLNAGIHSASKGSPAVDASGVYIGSDAGWFYAYTHDGRLRWRFYVGSADVGIHGSAVLTSDSVIIGAYNGRLYRLRKSDGEPIWVTRLGDAVGSSPVLVRGDLFVTAETGASRLGALYKIDSADGRVIWKTPWYREQIHSSPGWDESRHSLVFGANDGILRSVHGLSAEARWDFSIGYPIKGTPALTRDSALVTAWDGFIYRIDLAGARLIWKRNLASAGGYGSSQSSPLVFEKESRIVVLASESSSSDPKAPRDGRVLGLDLATGTIVWDHRGAGDGFALGSATGAMVKGVGAVAVSPCPVRSICVIGAVDGRKHQELELPSRLSGVPTIYRGAVFVALEGEGGLMKFESSPAEGMARGRK